MKLKFIKNISCRRRKSKSHRPCKSLMDDSVEIFDEYSNVQVGTECETNFHGHRVGYLEKKSENFTHVVDLDSYEFHKIIVYDFLGTILQSFAFRTFILALVLINAFLIGLQTVESLETRFGSYFAVIDHIILSIFIFEILLKWAHDFKMFWVVTWNVLDFVIVLLVIVSSILPNEGLFGATSNSKGILRVVRAFRSLRSVSSFSSLAIVTHTIVKSIGDMTSILFVLMIFMVVLSVMGVILFEINEINEHTQIFNSPLTAWLLLFVCITQDGWVDYMEAFRSKPGGSYFWLLMIYIIVAIGVGAFIFSNLIIAVVVANLEIGVAEIRAEKIASQNPLASHGEGSSQTVDIHTTYTIFSNENVPLRAQRPMKIPSLKHISERRLHAYIHLIVALEQNMLEHMLIETDLEKVMGVIISINEQLEKFNPSLVEEATKGTKVLKELTRLGSIPVPVDAFERMELLDDLRKIRQSTWNIQKDQP